MSTNNHLYNHQRKQGGDLEIEIGDFKQSEFYPQVKIKAWDNEANFSLRYIGMQAGNSVKDGNKVKLKNKTQEAHFYPTTVDLKPDHLAHRNDIDYAQKIQQSNEGFEHLKIGNSIIARDSSEERDIRKEAAREATGDVLLVGLGLGVMLEYLTRAKSITVVEISPSVVKYVEQYYPERLVGVKLIVDDFYHFAENTKQRFDYIYGDIFPSLLPGHTEDWWKFKEQATNLLNRGGNLTGRIEEYADKFRDSIITDIGHEFEILLKNKPESNVFQFSVQSKNVEFLYQPPLTEEQTAQGEFRPASVVGSYAIYHDSKMHNQYATGKVGHIYRPKVHDAEGKWTYANLEYKNEIMDITVPQEFLNRATYPVIVDPTFGYTTLGASNSGAIGSVAIRSSQFTGVVGTGVSISIGFSAKTSGIGATGGLYTRSGSINTLVTNSATSSDTTLVTSAFITVNFTIAPTLSAVNYDIITMVQGVGKGSSNNQAFDAGSANQGTMATTGDPGDTFTYPTLPSSYTITTLNTNKYSIFVTYNLIAATSYPVQVRIPNPKVGPMAMRYNFKFRPAPQYAAAQAVAATVSSSTLALLGVG